jgi:uncharacterized protein (TIGR02598 family)
MSRRVLARFGRPAFSLIEVAMAIGILAFCLVGILGLMPMALNNARDSRDDTRVAHLIETIHSDARTRRGVLTADSPAFKPLIINGDPITVKYLRDGQPAPASNPEAFFTAEVSLSKDADKLPLGFSGNRLDIELTWPGKSATATALLGP